VVDATISRARLRDLACLGRSRPRTGRWAAPSGTVRVATPGLTDAASIAFAISSRARAASLRPEDDNLMASTI
jgi:hypothetical protein